jgi:hypothetical protein
MALLELDFRGYSVLVTSVNEKPSKGFVNKREGFSGFEKK